MKKVIVIFTLIILSSCNKKAEDRAFFKSGNTKSLKLYDEDGNLIKFIQYYDLSGDKEFIVNFKMKDYDSLVSYYDNGKVFSTGRLDLNGNMFGNWNRFTREGYLSETREFYIVNKKSKLNQLWYFNKKGDTMFYANNKFNIYKQKEFMVDTLKARRTISINLEFHP